MYSPIKWTGSKNKQADEIVKLIPSKEIYYEPFLGGGAVFLKCLEHQLFNSYEVSDTNSDLIFLWNLIKENPLEIIHSYSQHWLKLRKDVNYYEEVKNNYNKKHDPLDFFFLTRTCTNGVIRNNKSGDFDSKLHKNNGGILPDNLSKFVMNAAYLLNNNNVEFKTISYNEIQYSKDAVIYLDPPHNDFDYGEFINFLIRLNKEGYKYAVSLNGNVNSESYIYNLNESLYVKKYEFSKSSYFVKMKPRRKLSKEYFYANYEIGTNGRIS